MHVHHFPNMLILGHAQGGFTVNYPHLLDEASRHAAHIVRHALDTNLGSFEATEEAERAWLATLAEAARSMCAFREQCTRGYYNNEGQPSDAGFLGSSYGKGAMAFFELLADWRAEGTMAGLELRR